MGRRSNYPEEFRTEAVRLALAAKAAGGTYAQVARDLSLNEQTLSNWIHADQVDTGDRPGLSKAERAELSELRKRVRKLEAEKEILGKAAAFFAKEGRFNR